MVSPLFVVGVDDMFRIYEMMKFVNKGAFFWMI